MTWADAVKERKCTPGEFHVAFERYKFESYGSSWRTGEEFFDCLCEFLNSDFVKIWSENE